ncbi:MAG: metallophosphoesterase [Eubacteriales bacterium]|nr:metallophosphoesterase [Eubacteriales bacterium]
MHSYVPETYEIHINRKELPKGYLKAAYLTDMHNTAGKEETAQILQMLRREKPDVIFCGGDMLVARPGVSCRPALDFMRELRTCAPVYMGTGNHEYRLFLYPETYGDMYEQYKKKLELTGTDVTTGKKQPEKQDSDSKRYPLYWLENAYRDAAVNGIPLHIAGYDLDKKYYKRLSREKLPKPEIQEAVGKPKRNAVNILLAHNPFYLRTYQAWGADLSLSGHYHGGVMRLGQHHGVISPDFHLFTPIAHGLFVRNGRNALVSSGCGEHTIPVRINNPREIVFLNLYVNQ